jgi:hydroxypyruvate reductase/glycerate 2-kinase
MDNRETGKKILMAGIEGVLPGRLMDDLVSVQGPVLKIGYCSYNLAELDRIFVVGAGKASAAMAHYLESKTGSRISGGHVVTKYGHSCRLRHVTVSEAGHPVPDSGSYEAAREILRIVSEAGDRDLVICLWSGGGSALMSDHPENSSPEEMAVLNDLLVRCGADIGEINAVRKHLSGIKGGQLAVRIRPADMVTILLSDVTGDQPDIIASGPTVPDKSTFGDALNVIHRHQLADRLPVSLVNYLREGTEGLRPETPKPGDGIFSGSAVFMAGTNRTALRSAKTEAEKHGFDTHIITDSLRGDTSEAFSYIAGQIEDYRRRDDLKKPVCLLFGGETTVRVEGSGKGGRNQHLALYAALKLKDMPGVTLVAAGTDGNDGDTDAAGAVVDSGTVKESLNIGMDPEAYLRNFDSYNFFRRAGGHIKTGPTLTNVMDLVIILISDN